MSSRPRRSAAQRASAAITDLAADRESSGTYGRTRRSLDNRDVSSRDRDRSMDRPSSSASADSHHVSATGKGSKPRQSAHGSPTTTRNEISVKTRSAPSEPASSKRSTRGNRKRYVESESDEEEEDEEQDVIRVGSARDADADADADDDDEEMEDMGDEDADGDPDDMEIDAEGEEDDEDAEGEPDDDMGESIVVTKPPSRAAMRKQVGRPSRKPLPRRVLLAPPVAAAANDDDDDELSELDSDVGDPNDETMLTTGDGLGDEDADGDPDDDVDAEGEEIEVATKAADDDDEDDDDDEELGSDAGSREDTPDFTKMTKRQRARFEDEPQEYMKLSDEVQVKKVFTAEELSMRRSEMARRRRNLSDKRNEEVKMETINKLLKKQPSKASRRAAAAAENEGEDGDGAPRANPLFVRWVSNKDGCHVSVPVEIVESPVGNVFAAGTGRKMVQEV